MKKREFYLTCIKKVALKNKLTLFRKKFDFLYIILFFVEEWKCLVKDTHQLYVLKAIILIFQTKIEKKRVFSFENLTFHQKKNFWPAQHSVPRDVQEYWSWPAVIVFLTRWYLIFFYFLKNQGLKQQKKNNWYPLLLKNFELKKFDFVKF